MNKNTLFHIHKFYNKILSKVESVSGLRNVTEMSKLCSRHLFPKNFIVGLALWLFALSFCIKENEFSLVPHLQNCHCKVLFAVFRLLVMNSQLNHVPVILCKCLRVIRMHMANSPAWPDPAPFILNREKLLESTPEESTWCLFGTFMVIYNCFIIKKCNRKF